MILCVYNEMHRIVKVDLKFPARPFVSPQAKDLISQVNMFLYILDFGLVVLAHSRIRIKSPHKDFVFPYKLHKDF